MPNTPNYNWNMPTVGSDLDVWGDELNATTILIDEEMFKKAPLIAPAFTGPVTVTGDWTVTGNGKVTGNFDVDGIIDAATIRFGDGSSITSAVAAQTPWTQNIEAAGFVLQHAGGIGIGATAAPTADSPFRVVSAGIGTLLIGANSNPIHEARIAVANDTGTLAYFTVYGSNHATAALRSQCVINAQTSIVLAPGFAEAVRVNTAGRTLFGPVTDNGSSRVQVSGTVRISSTAASASLVVTRNTTGAAAAFIADDGQSLANGGASITLGRSEVQPFTQLHGVASYNNSNGDGEFVLQVRNADTMAERVRVNNLGYMSVTGLTPFSPQFRIHAYGLGADQGGTIFTPSLNRSNSICANDASGSGFSGGAFVMASFNGPFAAIRGGYLGGAPHGVGVLSFYVRNIVGTEAIPEVVRINQNGSMSLFAMPTAAPAAGSKTLWADPADGYRVKFAN